MKFKFSNNLEHQQKAIEAIVGIFDTGRNIVQIETGFDLRNAGAIMINELEIDEARMLKNVERIQLENGIEVDHGLRGNDSLADFSIEMETGTGKTYVYLRTIFELNQQYGLKKFIVLVPSVAIREGVLKTIEQTKEHFRELYNTNFGAFAYDSGKLPRVREFAHSLDVQIMIMTIQSFNGDTKVMRQTNRDDTYNEKSYLAMVAKTQPVVIMDEPQNMESELAKSSIGDLNALFRLRYSATHKELHNLMYRLTPAEAYRRGLVKKIRVFGVKADDSGKFVFKVQGIEVKKGMLPKAEVLLEVRRADGEFGPREMILKAGDDLVRKTHNEKYTGLIVNDVDARYNRVELSDGKYYAIDVEAEDKPAIFRTQIRETIKAHLDKQEELGNRAKVLSLFFIDRVDNYVPADSLIRSIFTEEFEKLKTNYSRFYNLLAHDVHRGYFASKKEHGQTVYHDTRGDSKMDKEAYDLIMKDKERLLSFEEPVSFIFSHSALKEGWDNPNIFQICTLRETNSLMKKRQEIGRGLRLPVDVTGARIINEPSVSVLTVIANESYREYVGKLQREFNDSGYTDIPEAENGREEKIPVKAVKKLIDSDDFKKLWDRINKRTKYSIELNTEALIENAIKKINELDVNNLVVTVEKVDVFFDKNGKVETVYGNASAGARLDRDIRIGNIIDRIARETGITRKTAFEIFSRAENADLLFENPEEYMRSIVMIIRHSLQDLLINEGLRYMPTGDLWEIDLFSDFESLPSKSLESKKSIYDHVVFDSAGERQFAESLENSSNVKVYAKLPRGFVVDTPLGNYTPDWAIVWGLNEGVSGNEKLYLVRETKFGYPNLMRDLSLVERQKILCGKKHFESIGFEDFKVAEKSDLSDLI